MVVGPSSVINPTVFSFHLSQSFVHLSLQKSVVRYSCIPQLRSPSVTPVLNIVSRTSPPAARFLSFLTSEIVTKGIRKCGPFPPLGTLLWVGTRQGHSPGAFCLRVGVSRLEMEVTQNTGNFLLRLLCLKSLFMIR